MKSLACSFALASILILVAGCSGSDDSSEIQPPTTDGGADSTPDATNDSNQDSAPNDSGEFDSAKTDSSSPDSSLDSALPDSTVDSSHDSSPPDSALDSSTPDSQDSSHADSSADSDAASTDAGSAKWNVVTVDDTPNFKARVALAISSKGAAHLAYNVATDPKGWFTPSVWYAYPNGNSWKSVEAAPAQSISNEFPILALDNNDSPHLAYNRNNTVQNQVDVFYLQSTGVGTFAAAKNLNSTAKLDEFATNMVSDSAGDLHLLIQEKNEVSAGTFEYAIRYIKLHAGKIVLSESLATNTAPYSLDPDYDLAVDSAFNVHTVFGRPATNPDYSVLYYRKRTSSGWQKEELVSASAQDIWGPSIGVDASLTVHLSYVEGPDWDTKSLKYQSRDASKWSTPLKLSSSIEDRSYFAGLAVEPSGKVHIAFTRLYNSNADLFYLGGKNGVFDPEERITNTANGDEGCASMGFAPNGKLFIAYVENLSNAPNGRVYLATKP